MRWVAWFAPSRKDSRRKKLRRPVTNSSARPRQRKRARLVLTTSSSMNSRPKRSISMRASATLRWTNLPGEHDAVHPRCREGLRDYRRDLRRSPGRLRHVRGVGVRVKFAKIVFTIAGIWGLLILTPHYFA